MEKKILIYSYWLGMLFAALAVVWRITDAFGFYVTTIPGRVPFSPITLLKGALLFLIVSMATGAYQSAKT